MKTKFVLSYIFGLLWLAVSLWFAIFWAGELTTVWPAWYVWGVIGGIALLPGFLMSSMFFSNLLHRKVQQYPDIAESVTVIMCAHNEEEQIAGAIRAVLNQRYRGCIRLLVVDNASTDGTRGEILLQKAYADGCRRRLEYLYCGKKGKAHALNCALKRVCTKHFITVDADTYLEKQAVQKIMNHICACQSGCVAGNLFVKNPRASLAAAMQNYDYLLSIAAVKRFQGSYRSTLVAQGAFSAYDTAAVRQVGGWKDVLGEDIVLTYQLLEKGFGSEYQAAAVGYTTVPETISGLYNQRKRWAAGMLEGLSTVRPWQQGSIYSRHFSLVNLSVIWLDLAFLFGFVPGLLLAALGYFYLAGCLTLTTLAVCLVFFLSTYLYQKQLHIPFYNSVWGFVWFLAVFQMIQSTAAIHGYLLRLLHRKGEWK